MNLVLNTDANQKYSNVIGEPRVKPEAADNAIKGKGMAGLVIQGKVPGDSAPGPRVKPEAEDIAFKNKGTLTNMYHNYGKLPNSGRPNPKIKGGAGQEIYTRGTKGVVHNLFYQYGGLPNDPKPAARVRPEAKRIANKSQGSMGTLMNPKKTYRPRSSAW
jgi:hypothetical protein